MVKEIQLKFGERNNRASKLTQALVDKIREEYAEGATQRELGHRYNVTAVQIGRIVRLECWRPSAFVMKEQSGREKEGVLGRMMQAQREANIAAGRPANEGIGLDEPPARPSALQRMQAELVAKNPDRLLDELKGESNDRRDEGSAGATDAGGSGEGVEGKAA